MTPANAKLSPDTPTCAIYKFGSRAAMMWLSGREASEDKARIVGFEDFAKSLTHITRASSKDNPFADARLLKIEHTLKELEAFLDRREAVYQSLLASGKESIERPPLYFEASNLHATQYAAAGAWCSHHNCSRR